MKWRTYLLEQKSQLALRSPIPPRPIPPPPLPVDILPALLSWLLCSPLLLMPPSEQKLLPWSDCCWDDLAVTVISVAPDSASLIVIQDYQNQLPNTSPYQHVARAWIVAYSYPSRGLAVLSFLFSDDLEI